jgi:asparagine synthase (glutamine-hydrolysing)
MSGIVGLWNLDGAPVESDLFARLSATLAHRGPDGEGRCFRGPVALGCQLLRVTPESLNETQPLLDAAGAVAVFDGRLDDRDELLAALGPSAGVGPASPDPALVLAAYRAFGDRFAERLNGDFALALYDPARQRLLLARDAVGVRPLYYCRAGAAFLFASEVKALLAHPRVRTRPNDDLLADYVFAGLPGLDDEGLTFFEGVHSVPPAHVAEVTPRGVTVRRYWDFEPARSAPAKSFPEFAEAFGHHFERAVRRRLRSASPVGVSVSGGLDSSAIFCTAEALRRGEPGRYPQLVGASYTYPEGTPADEAAYLGEIERAYGVDIERVPLARPGMLGGCKEAVWHVEAPLPDCQWNGATELHDVFRRRGARVLLTGTWGDQVLCDRAYLTDLVRRLAWGRVRAHLQEYPRWFLDAAPGVFRRDFWSDLVRHHVPDRLVPWLRRLRSVRARTPHERSWYAPSFRGRAVRNSLLRPAPRGPFAKAHGNSLYRRVRSRYCTLCLEWNNKVGAMFGVERAFPFLDRDLLSFLMNTPGEMVSWKGVPKAFLRESGNLPEGIARRRDKADFTDWINAGLRREFPELVRLLRSGGAAVRRGYVADGVLEEELARWRGRIQGPDCLVSWGLRDLLGLELWLQHFFGEDPGGARRGALYESVSSYSDSKVAHASAR